MKKILIFLTAAILLLAIFYGFYFSWPHWLKGLKPEGEYGFLENLLSEGIGLILEAVIVTIIVSYIISQNEIKKWKHIRTTLTDSLTKLAVESMHPVSMEILEKIQKTPLLWDRLDASIQKVLENNHHLQKDKIPALLEENIKQLETLKSQYLISINYELMKFTIEIKEGIEKIIRFSSQPVTTNCTMQLGNGEIKEYNFKTECDAHEEIILKSLKQREGILDFKKNVSNSLDKQLKNLISKKHHFQAMLDNTIIHGEMTAILLEDYNEFFEKNKTFESFTPIKFCKAYQGLLN